jgi:hypothetical protein
MIYQHPGLDAIRNAVEQRNLALANVTNTSQRGKSPVVGD